MKIRAVSALMCIVLAAALTACEGASSDAAASSASAETAEASSAAETSEAGSTEENTEEAGAESVYTKILSLPISEDEYKIEDCIALGEYKGLELTRTVKEVTEEDVAAKLESMAGAVSADAAEDGDIVNIDYVGTIDGEPFEGGSAEGYDLEIGSGLFIDGFEEGLIGAEKGDTVELNLTFPEDYYENLAGKDVLFTVTVNSITRRETQDDAWVKEYTDGAFDSLEDYMGSIREGLEADEEKTADSVLQSTAWTAVQENSEYFQLPSSYYEEGTSAFDANYQSAAEQNGFESLDEYIASLEDYGVTREMYEQERDRYARYTAASIVLLDALAEAEGLDKDSEEYQTQLSALEELYDMDEAALIEMSGEHNVYMYVMTQAVADRIISYSTVKNETVSVGDQ